MADIEVNTMWTMVSFMVAGFLNISYDTSHIYFQCIEHNKHWQNRTSPLGSCSLRNVSTEMIHGSGM